MSVSPALDRALLDRRRCACLSGLRALRCCDMVPAAMPDPEALAPLESLVETARTRLGSGDEAPGESLLINVLELAPDHPGALRLLYQRRAGQNRAPAADALLARFVAHHPNDPWARCEMALRRLREGDLGQAEAACRSAIRLAPQNHQVQEVAGLVLMAANQPHAAEHHFRRAIALVGGRPPKLIARLAACLHAQSRLDEARALYEEADIAAPNSADILLSWARTEEAAKDFATAALLLDRADALLPQNEAIALARAGLQDRAKNHAAALATLDAIALPSPEILLTRGRVLDRLGRTEEAFGAWRSAKAAMIEQGGRTYPAAEVQTMQARLGNFFTATRLATLPRAEPRPDQKQPIFILGFPRSGTTLVEQMLSAHPKIAGGDELPMIHALIQAAPLLLGSPLGYPEALAELWMGDGQDGLDVLRDHYLRGARKLRAPDPAKPWFTDKMPLNETHLGLIGLLFPASPLIHLVRHPLDVVLSVFSNQLTHGFNCASSLESAARHYALIADLTAHYRREMALKYLVVRYEDVVAGAESALRRMLDFIGEDFDPACLRFTENARYARTASHAQVTEPLYDRSLERWRRYQEELAPAVAILEPTMRRLGYTVTS